VACEPRPACDQPCQQPALRFPVAHGSDEVRLRPTKRKGPCGELEPTRSRSNHGDPHRSDNHPSRRCVRADRSSFSTSGCCWQRQIQLAARSRDVSDQASRACTESTTAARAAPHVGGASIIQTPSLYIVRHRSCLSPARRTRLSRAMACSTGKLSRTWYASPQVAHVDKPPLPSAAVLQATPSP